MTGYMRRLVGVGLTVGVLCTLGLLAASGARADDPGCVGANVAANNALSVPATMHGTLCLPADGKASTVMVLVPGATYNHTYWDFPYDPQVYNFREAMNRAGYATFVVDRLGTGRSSRPPGAILTSIAEATAVHDVITALRAGTIGGIAFGKVILGGHSLGSTIAVSEAGTYNDENGVLLTGIAHTLNPNFFVSYFPQTLYPAVSDPKFAGMGYGPAYETTRPGTRRPDFYSPQTTDSNVVAEDEKTKDVASLTELGTGVGIGFLSPYSALIKAPVLLADGQYDLISCLDGNCGDAAAVKTREAPYFAGSSCFETYVLAGSGHDVNLATDTQDYQRDVERWADAFVGTGPGTLTPPGCGG